MDLNQIPSSTHGHEFQSGQSRVVMVRKTEQRTFQVPQAGEQGTTFEQVTRETVQTFNGQRVQQTTTHKRAVYTDADSPGDRKIVVETREENGGPSAGDDQGGEEDSSGHQRAPRRRSSTPNRQVRRGQSPNAKSNQGGASGGGGKRGSSSGNPGANKDDKSQARQKKSGSSPGRSDGGNDYSNFAEDCLQTHNKYRSKHNVPPLKLSRKLCQYSEEWARRLASTGQMQHRPNSDYGENLFCVWSSDPNHKVTGNEPVDNWYAEIKDFRFGQEPRDLRAGHFTQVVWKDSRQLGVGLSKSKNGQTFVVCNYDPPGNFIGNFASQVPPIGGDSKSGKDNGKSDDKFYDRSAPKDDSKSEGKNAPSSTSKGSANEQNKPDSKSAKGGKADDSEKADTKGSDNKAAGQSDTVLQNECVDIHNFYRSKHGCPPISHDSKLSQLATEWANTLIKDNKFAHRPNNKYGENIFCHWTNDPSGADKIGAKDAVNSWYSEIKYFRFGEEPKTLKAGHFTQVIWKNTKNVGMGRATDGKGRVVVVANYDPRGNYVGQFANNCPIKK